MRDERARVQPTWQTAAVLDGAVPPSVAGSPGWVAVTSSSDVTRTEIGCSAWVLVFCGEPYDVPVLPERLSAAR